MAAVLWRATMPTPSPSIEANETKRTAHRLVSTIVDVSPASMPAIEAPAIPAIRPAAPRTPPKAAAVSVFAAAMASRAERWWPSFRPCP